MRNRECSTFFFVPFFASSSSCVVIEYVFSLDEWQKVSAHIALCQKHNNLQQFVFHLFDIKSTLEYFLRKTPDVACHSRYSLLGSFEEEKKKWEKWSTTCLRDFKHLKVQQVENLFISCHFNSYEKQLSTCFVWNVSGSDRCEVMNLFSMISRRKN